MTLEKVSIGESVAASVDKVNGLIDAVVDTSDTVEDFKDGTMAVKKAEEATYASNVRVNNIDNATSPRPIAIAASGMDKSPIFVNPEFLNYTPSTGIFRAPKFSENGTLLENKYATKVELEGVATTAGKIDDVKVNGSSVVSNKVANIGIPTKVSQLQNDSDFIPATQKAVANGVASLDGNGKVPTSQLPSFVDDVLEYSNKSGFPATGEAGKIYVDQSTNLTYRWSGSQYTEISKSLALGETSSTAYAGNQGKANREYINSLMTDVNDLKTRVPVVEQNTVSSVQITFSSSTTANSEGLFTKTFDVANLNNDGENLGVNSYIPVLVLSGTAPNLSPIIVDWQSTGSSWTVRTHIALTNAIAVFIKIPVTENKTL